MHLHLRLDVLLVIVAAICVTAVLTSTWPVLLLLIPVALWARILWKSDDRMLDQMAREQVDRETAHVPDLGTRCDGRHPSGPCP